MSPNTSSPNTPNSGDPDDRPLQSVKGLGLPRGAPCVCPRPPSAHPCTPSGGEPSLKAIPELLRAPAEGLHPRLPRGEEGGDGKGAASEPGQQHCAQNMLVKSPWEDECGPVLPDASSREVTTKNNVWLHSVTAEEWIPT